MNKMLWMCTKCFKTVESPTDNNCYKEKVSFANKKKEPAFVCPEIQQSVSGQTVKRKKYVRKYKKIESSTDELTLTNKNTSGNNNFLEVNK